jgi:pyruvate dehydrogenase E1 component
MASQVEVDPQETREWLEALDAVVASDGAQRAQFLLERVVGHAQLTGAAPAPAGTTPYLNTIPPQDEPAYPVDEALERRVRSIVRWNAIATILNANKESSELGGHIASYQSAAVLYETGFNHFWHAPTERHGGDLVYMQGHSSPGFYARAFLEGRIPVATKRNGRMEVGGNGLSS